MGLPDPVSFLVVPPPLPSEAVDPDRLDRERTVEQAMTGRADVRSQQLGVEAVSNKVREAKSGYWPQLDLFGNMRSGYSTWDDETSFEDQFFEDQVVGSFGLSVSIPLFDRLRTRTSVHQARAESRITQLELAKLRQEVAVEVGRAIEDYRTALQQVSVAQDQLEAARLALSATQERYAVGASTLLELTAARNTMLQANTDWVNARYDLVEKRLTLAHIEGSLMEVLPTFYSVEEIQ